MLVAAGVMAMVLGACGEGSKKPEEMKSETASEQMKDHNQQDDDAAKSDDTETKQDDKSSESQDQDSQSAPTTDTGAVPTEQ
jgi:hypothetical protein